MLYGLWYFYNFLIIHTIIETLCTGYEKLPRHWYQTITIQIEDATIGFGHTKEMWWISQFLYDNVSGFSWQNHNFDITFGYFQRFIEYRFNRFTLISWTATDAATIILHIRIDNPIATNFLKNITFSGDHGRLWNYSGWILVVVELIYSPCKCHQYTCYWCPVYMVCHPAPYHPSWLWWCHRHHCNIIYRGFLEEKSKQKGNYRLC